MSHIGIRVTVISLFIVTRCSWLFLYPKEGPFQQLKTGSPHTQANNTKIINVNYWMKHVHMTNMYLQKEVKSGVPEIVNTSCPNSWDITVGLNEMEKLDMDLNINYGN